MVAAQSDLSPAETRVAAVVLGAPADVAFGTVAALARAAGTGAATVVRFTTKLGYRGFADLRASVRAELSESLRPAAERIREPAAHDVVHLALHAELDNVRTTLEGIDRHAFKEATRLLSRRAARVFITSGEASAGVALLMRDHLSMLRPGVELLRGSPVRVVGELATASTGDVLVAIDVRLPGPRRGGADGRPSLAAGPASHGCLHRGRRERGPFRQPRRGARLGERAPGRRCGPPTGCRRRAPRRDRVGLGQGVGPGRAKLISGPGPRLSLAAR